MMDCINKKMYIAACKPVPYGIVYLSSVWINNVLNKAFI